MSLKKSDSSRFWSKVNKSGPKQPHMKTRCWIWIGSLKDSGYGQFFVTSYESPVSAHKWLYERRNGLVVKPFEVCHHCDERRCVRLSHLFVGTRSDNMKDAAAKGRIRTNRVLTPDLIKRIRFAYVRGRNGYIAVSRQFGLSPSTIRNAVKGYDVELEKL